MSSEEMSIEPQTRLAEDALGTCSHFLAGSQRAVFSSCTANRTSAAASLEPECRACVARLAGGLAHNLNNLLTVILGNSALLWRDLAGHQRAEIAAIARAAERAADLVSQISAYAGNAALSLEPLALNAIIGDVEQRLRPSLSPNIELVHELDPELPAVLGDRHQMEELIVSLLLNASEAIGETAPGSIRIRTTRREASWDTDSGDDLIEELRGQEECVGLEVADTGCGMDQPVKSQIFEPFFSTKAFGRGLGLAAVAGIVWRHHGAIQVDSQPKGGTIFRTLFPADRTAGRRRTSTAAASLQNPGG